MDRSPDELIAAMRAFLEVSNGAGFFVGGNELARLVLEYERLKADAREASIAERR
jgi:hypothetical protein